MMSSTIAVDQSQPRVPKRLRNEDTAPPQPAKLAAITPRDMRHLFGDSACGDVVLSVAGSTIKCHRAILTVVPFFEAAFRTAPAMQEGQGSVLTITLARNTEYSRLLLFIKYVYGYPTSECIATSMTALLSQYGSCELYDYKPFLDTVWAAVTAIRAQHDELQWGSLPDGAILDRIRSAKFAATRGLPIQLQVCDISYNLPSTVCLYLCKTQDVKLQSGWSADDIRASLMARWLRQTRLYIEETWKELRALCDVSKVNVGVRNRLAAQVLELPQPTPAVLYRFVIEMLVAAIPSL